MRPPEAVNTKQPSLEPHLKDLTAYLRHWHPGEAFERGYWVLVAAYQPSAPMGIRAGIALKHRKQPHPSFQWNTNWQNCGQQMAKPKSIDEEFSQFNIFKNSFFFKFEKKISCE